jgi:hypothetical protein
LGSLQVFTLGLQPVNSVQPTITSSLRSRIIWPMASAAFDIATLRSDHYGRRIFPRLLENLAGTARPIPA